MIKGLKLLLHEENLRGQELFSPEKRRLQGGLMNMYKYLKGGYTEGGARLFPAVPCDKKMGTSETQEVPHEYQEMIFE